MFQMFSRRFLSSVTGNGALLLSETSGSGVKKLVMNTPRSLNALSLRMLNRLHEEISSASQCRAIIIESSSKVFCAGHDLKELQNESPDAEARHQEIFDLCTEVMCGIREAPCPVIAHVWGPAVAAGCQLAASCDMIFATKSSSFSLPGVKIGLFCTTPAVAVGRALPAKIVFEMLTTGEPITGETAYTHGLVTKLAEDKEELLQVSDSILQKICSHSGDVIALGKREFYNQMSKENTRAAYCSAQPVMVSNITHRHCQTGIEAFFDKRKPDFS